MLPIFLKRATLQYSNFLVSKMEQHAFYFLDSNKKTSFDLFQAYYLTSSEREKLLNGQNILQKAYFYLYGYHYEIEHKIDAELKSIEKQRDIFQRAITPLKPSDEVRKLGHQLFNAQKNNMENLKRFNRFITPCITTVATLSAIALGYLCARFYSDWDAHCNVQTEVEAIRKLHEEQCFKSNPYGYSKNLLESLAAVPLIVLLGGILQFYDSEIISKLVFSPVEKAQQTSTTMLEKTRYLRDFLLQSALTPSI